MPGVHHQNLGLCSAIGIFSTREEICIKFFLLKRKQFVGEKKNNFTFFFFGTKVLCLLAGSQLSAVQESTAANALKNEDCVGPEATAAWSTSPRALGGQWDGRKRIPSLLTVSLNDFTAGRCVSVKETQAGVAPAVTSQLRPSPCRTPRGGCGLSSSSLSLCFSSFLPFSLALSSPVCPFLNFFHPTCEIDVVLKRRKPEREVWILHRSAQNRHSQAYRLSFFRKINLKQGGLKYKGNASGKGFLTSGRIGSGWLERSYFVITKCALQMLPSARVIFSTVTQPNQNNKFGI